jgi:hypothetical protein
MDLVKNIEFLYTLLGGLIVGLGWLFRLQSRISLLELELKLTKEAQHNQNQTLIKELDIIKESIEGVRKYLIQHGGK